MPVFLFGDSNVRGDRAGGWKGRLKRLLLPRVLRLCDGVVACGSLGEEYFARYGVPREAARGGAETMYPEYRKKVKDAKAKLVVER